MWILQRKIAGLGAKSRISNCGLIGTSENDNGTTTQRTIDELHEAQLVGGDPTLRGWGEPGRLLIRKDLYMNSKPNQ
jgi:hypothetical protein